MVRARSAAEMPVVTPSRASTETVKAVWKGASFLAAIRLRPSSLQRSSVSARQIRPRPCVAMKLTASGVANWAAIVRSPSFSRFSSSQTTTIRPRRMSSIASSIVAKGDSVFVSVSSAPRSAWPSLVLLLARSDKGDMPASVDSWRRT